MSESVPKKIYAKLLAVQKEVSVVSKNRQGYNYKYEDLNSIIEHLHPELTQQGLGIIHQVVNNLEGNYICVTTVFDAEGEKIKIECPIIGAGNLLAKGNPMQGMGSAITYARRYNLKNLFNLYSEDDDGAAMAKPKQAAVDLNRPASDKQVKFIEDLVKQFPEDKWPAIYEWIGCSVSDLTDAQARQKISGLQERLKLVAKK